jgi:hypothetical protein
VIRQVGEQLLQQQLLFDPHAGRRHRGAQLAITKSGQIQNSPFKPGVPTHEGKTRMRYMTACEPASISSRRSSST